MRLALETYTLRKQAKKNLAKTLEDIKALGFSAIELSHIPLTDENIALIKRSTLHVSGIMAPLSHFQKDTHHWVSLCKTLRCSRLVVSRLSIPSILGGVAPLRKFISQMNQLSCYLQQHAIKLCFHHHAWEFKVINGKTRMDILLDEFRLPIKIISDVYWLTYANQAIIPFYDRLGSRLEGFHLRDLQYRWVKGKKKAYGCPMGSGVIDWKIICGHAHKTAYAAIELKSKTPQEDIRQSLDFIHNLHVKEGK